jgi:hypothetical protein
MQPSTLGLRIIKTLERGGTDSNFKALFNELLTFLYLALNVASFFLSGIAVYQTLTPFIYCNN